MSETKTESHAATLERWKREANGVDLGERIDAGMAKELSQAGPQQIKKVIDRLIAEGPSAFPTFAIYAVFDQKLQAFVEPQFHVNDQVAVREARDACLNGHRFSRTPDDFILFRLGEWDQQTGDVIPDEAEIVSTFKEICDG